MKKMLLALLEPSRATMLIAFAIGLGIAVHPGFFLVALAVAIAAFAETIVNATFTHRHP